MSKRYLQIFCAALLSLSVSSVLAEQTKIPDYKTARYLFWSKVYPKGGKTLYCAQPFSTKKKSGINIEHVYPMSWVTKALNCGRRKECRDVSARFNNIEADLHNLFPARTDINDERSSMPFANIKGEKRRYGKCDFEMDGKRRVVEPADAARGEIARAMFYMAETYGFEIFRKQAKMLKEWHFKDLPSKIEKQRNDIIEKIQGTRNMFVDDPELVNALDF